MWVFSGCYSSVSHLLVLLLCVAAPTVHAQTLEAVKSSVVRIVSPSQEGKPRTGTGFVIKIEGDAAYIATASHVIEGDSAPQVEFFGRRNRPVKATVVRLEGGDPKGLALLMVRGAENLPRGLPSLAFAPSSELQGGEEVVLIGFGQGQGDWAVIRAHVTSVDGRDFKLDGRIEEGNSGGPVLKDGRVVALVTSKSQGFGVATPSLVVQDLFRRWGVETVAAASERSATIESKTKPAATQPAASTPSAQTDRYLLAGLAVPAGRVTRGSGKFEVRNGVLVVSVGGMSAPPGTMTMTYEQAGQMEILAVTDGQPSKVKRTIEKMNWRFRREFAGETGTEDVPSPLQGRAFVVTRDGDTWRLAGGGDQLSRELQDDLRTLFSSDLAYPKEPVAVGHRWELSEDQLAQFLGLGAFAVTDGSASFEFEKVVDCAGERCAAIEVRLRAEGSVPDESGNQMIFTLEGNGSVLRSLTHGIDRQFRLSGQIQLNAAGMQNGTPFAMTVSGPFTLSGQSSLK